MIHGLQLRTAFGGVMKALVMRGSMSTGGSCRYCKLRLARKKAPRQLNVTGPEGRKCSAWSGDDFPFYGASAGAGAGAGGVAVGAGAGAGGAFAGAGAASAAAGGVSAGAAAAAASSTFAPSLQHNGAPSCKPHFSQTAASVLQHTSVPAIWPQLAQRVFPAKSPSIFLQHNAVPLWNPHSPQTSPDESHL